MGGFYGHISEVKFGAVSLRTRNIVMKTIQFFEEEERNFVQAGRHKIIFYPTHKKKTNLKVAINNT